MTMNEQGNAGLIRMLFDAIPSFVFVVDEDVRIYEYNSAVAALLSAEKRTILRQRGGEALYCLHSNDVPEGCGRAPYCENCVIRNSVKEAFQGNKVFRSRHKMELVRDGNVLEIYALITASPVLFQGNKLVLLVVEDINEVVELQHIIPICAMCKKVRDDKDYWMQVESYFKAHLDIDFSHGLCPDCYKKQMSELENLIKAKQSDRGDSK
jgi:hypothetical protein